MTRAARLRVLVRDLRGLSVANGTLLVSSGGATHAAEMNGTSVSLPPLDGQSMTHSACVPIRDGIAMFTTLSPGRYAFEAHGSDMVCVQPDSPLEVFAREAREIEVRVAAVVAVAARFAPDRPATVAIKEHEGLFLALGASATARASARIVTAVPGATVLVALSKAVPPPGSIDAELVLGPERAVGKCLLVPASACSVAQAIPYQSVAVPGRSPVTLTVRDRTGRVLPGISGIAVELRDPPERKRRTACSAGVPVQLPPGRYELRLDGLGMAVGARHFVVEPEKPAVWDVELPLESVNTTVAAKYPDGRIPQGFSLSVEAGPVKFVLHSNGPGAIPVSLPAGRVRLTARVGAGEPIAVDVDVVASVEPEALTLTLPAPK